MLLVLLAVPIGELTNEVLPKDGPKWEVDGGRGARGRFACGIGTVGI